MSTHFLFFTERLSLDFCNTAGAGFERLQEPPHLDEWLKQAGRPIERPTEKTEFDEARALRDQLRVALLAGDALAIAELADTWFGPTPMRLCVDVETLGTHAEPVGRTCHCALVPVVLDALEIAREHPGRVRECASDGCPALFLDLSRNKSRRWCSMELCGSREKSRAYFKRRRKE